MMKEYLSQYSLLPVCVMLTFFVSFLYFTYAAIRMSRQDSNKFSEMPLEIDEKLQQEKVMGGINHDRS